MSTESQIDTWIESRAHRPMSELWNELASDRWKEAAESHVIALNSLTLENLIGVWLAGSVTSFRSALESSLSSSDISKMVQTYNNYAAKMKPSEDVTKMLERLFSTSRDRGVDPLDMLILEKSAPNPLSALVKNPTKQNLYEPAAAAYMRKNLPSDRFPLVARMASLNVSVRFTPSGVPEVGSKRQRDSGKSVDLVIAEVREEKVIILLGTHKFARVPGGHQDNQLDDARGLIKAIKACVETENEGSVVAELKSHLPEHLQAYSVQVEPFAVLDGEYFANKEATSDEMVLQGDTDKVIAILKRRG